MKLFAIAGYVQMPIFVPSKLIAMFELAIDAAQAEGKALARLRVLYPEGSPNAQVVELPMMFTHENHAVCVLITEMPVEAPESDSKAE